MGNVESTATRQDAQGRAEEVDLPSRSVSATAGPSGEPPPEALRHCSSHKIDVFNASFSSAVSSVAGGPVAAIASLQTDDPNLYRSSLGMYKSRSRAHLALPASLQEGEQEGPLSGNGNGGEEEGEGGGGAPSTVAGEAGSVAGSAAPPWKGEGEEEDGEENGDGNEVEGSREREREGNHGSQEEVSAVVAAAAAAMAGGVGHATHVGGHRRADTPITPSATPVERFPGEEPVQAVCRRQFRPRLDTVASAPDEERGAGAADSLAAAVDAALAGRPSATRTPPATPIEEPIGGVVGQALGGVPDDAATACGVVYGMAAGAGDDAAPADPPPVVANSAAADPDATPVSVAAAAAAGATPTATSAVLGALGDPQSQDGGLHEGAAAAGGSFGSAAQVTVPMSTSALEAEVQQGGMDTGAALEGISNGGAEGAASAADDSQVMSQMVARIMAAVVAGQQAEGAAATDAANATSDLPRAGSSRFTRAFSWLWRTKRAPSDATAPEPAGARLGAAAADAPVHGATDSTAGGPDGVAAAGSVHDPVAGAEASAPDADADVAPATALAADLPAAGTVATGPSAATEVGGGAGDGAAADDDLAAAAALGLAGLAAAGGAKRSRGAPAKGITSAALTNAVQGQAVPVEEPGVGTSPVQQLGQGAAGADEVACGAAGNGAGGREGSVVSGELSDSQVVAQMMAQVMAAVVAGAGQQGTPPTAPAAPAPPDASPAGVTTSPELQRSGSFGIRRAVSWLWRRPKRGSAEGHEPQPAAAASTSLEAVSPESGPEGDGGEAAADPAAGTSGAAPPTTAAADALTAACDPSAAQSGTSAAALEEGAASEPTPTAARQAASLAAAHAAAVAGVPPALTDLSRYIATAESQVGEAAATTAASTDPSGVQQREAAATSGSGGLTAALRQVALVPAEDAKERGEHDEVVRRGAALALVRAVDASAPVTDVAVGPCDAAPQPVAQAAAALGDGEEGQAVADVDAKGGAQEDRDSQVVSQLVSQVMAAVVAGQEARGAGGENVTAATPPQLQASQSARVLAGAVTTSELRRSGSFGIGRAVGWLWRRPKRDTSATRAADAATADDTAATAGAAGATAAASADPEETGAPGAAADTAAGAPSDSTTAATAVDADVVPNGMLAMPAAAADVGAGSEEATAGVEPDVETAGATEVPPITAAIVREVEQVVAPVTGAPAVVTAVTAATGTQQGAAVAAVTAVTMDLGAAVDDATSAGSHQVADGQDCVAAGSTGGQVPQATLDSAGQPTSMPQAAATPGQVEGGGAAGHTGQEEEEGGAQQQVSDGLVVSQMVSQIMSALVKCQQEGGADGTNGDSAADAGGTATVPQLHASQSVRVPAGAGAAGAAPQAPELRRSGSFGIGRAVGWLWRRPKRDTSATRAADAATADDTAATAGAETGVPDAAVAASTADVDQSPDLVGASAPAAGVADAADRHAGSTLAAAAVTAAITVVASEGVAAVTGGQESAVTRDLGTAVDALTAVVHQAPAEGSTGAGSGAATGLRGLLSELTAASTATVTATPSSAAAAAPAPVPPAAGTPDGVITGAAGGIRALLSQLTVPGSFPGQSRAALVPSAVAAEAGAAGPAVAAEPPGSATPTEDAGGASPGSSLAAAAASGGSSNGPDDLADRSSTTATPKKVATVAGHKNEKSDKRGGSHVTMGPLMSALVAAVQGSPRATATAAPHTTTTEAAANEHAAAADEQAAAEPGPGTDGVAGSEARGLGDMLEELAAAMQGGNAHASTAGQAGTAQVSEGEGLAAANPVTGEAVGAAAAGGDLGGLGAEPFEGFGAAEGVNSAAGGSGLGAALEELAVAVEKAMNDVPSGTGAGGDTPQSHVAGVEQSFGSVISQITAAVNSPTSPCDAPSHGDALGPDSMPVTAAALAATAPADAAPAAGGGSGLAGNLSAVVSQLAAATNVGSELVGAPTRAAAVPEDSTPLTDGGAGRGTVASVISAAARTTAPPAAAFPAAKDTATAAMAAAGAAAGTAGTRDPFVFAAEPQAVAGVAPSSTDVAGTGAGADEFLAGAVNPDLQLPAKRQRVGAVDARAALAQATAGAEAALLDAAAAAVSAAAIAVPASTAVPAATAATADAAAAVGPGTAGAAGAAARTAVRIAEAAAAIVSPFQLNLTGGTVSASGARGAMAAKTGSNEHVTGSIPPLPSTGPPPALKRSSGPAAAATITGCGSDPAEIGTAVPAVQPFARGLSAGERTASHDSRAILPDMAQAQALVTRGTGLSSSTSHTTSSGSTMLQGFPFRSAEAEALGRMISAVSAASAASEQRSGHVADISLADMANAAGVPEISLSDMVTAAGLAQGQAGPVPALGAAAADSRPQGVILQPQAPEGQPGAVSTAPDAADTSPPAPDGLAGGTDTAPPVVAGVARGASLAIGALDDVLDKVVCKAPNFDAAASDVDAAAVVQQSVGAAAAAMSDSLSRGPLLPVSEGNEERSTYGRMHPKSEAACAKSEEKGVGSGGGEHGSGAVRHGARPFSPITGPISVPATEYASSDDNEGVEQAVGGRDSAAGATAGVPPAVTAVTADVTVAPATGGSSDAGPKAATNATTSGDVQAPAAAASGPKAVADSAREVHEDPNRLSKVTGATAVSQVTQSVHDAVVKKLAGDETVVMGPLGMHPPPPAPRSPTTPMIQAPIGSPIVSPSPPGGHLPALAATAAATAGVAATAAATASYAGSAAGSVTGKPRSPGGSPAKKGPLAAAALNTAAVVTQAAQRAASATDEAAEDDAAAVDMRADVRGGKGGRVRNSGSQPRRSFWGSCFTCGSGSVVQ